VKIPLPPQIQDKVRDRRADRYRMEITEEHAKWLAELIGKEVEAMDIDDPRFKGIFGLLRSILDQVEKRESK